MPEAQLLEATAIPLTGAIADYDALIHAIGDRRFVLLGEASHGTHEFYLARAEITRRLIAEHGFHAVAVEADWPDAYSVNRWVRGLSDAGNANEALSDFRRFPAWMWRNADVLDFVGWLRDHNDALPADRKAGFYGLDLYSLHASIDAVLRYLATVDPEAAVRAKRRYSCFDHFGEDPQAYGYMTTRGGADSCEQDVVEQLLELRRKAGEYARMDGRVARDEFFFAEQNARLARNAEEYYRAMYRGANSWNLRDRHMTETLVALDTHLSQEGEPARIVVWEHNSHLGDARATERSRGGQLNVGQLVRERYGSEALLVGFTTHSGTVTAASDWDGPAERKRVLPALADSYEALLHRVGAENFYVLMTGGRSAADLLREQRLERAIGVIYRPETERSSHYFYASLSQQFDAVIHFDHSRAVEPLERDSQWTAGEPPATYPSSL